MSNNYFQFKQFRVEQNQVGLKVTTDACLFGAWVASQKITAKSVLDIGAGTGLLSLMLSQQHSAEITALEIDKHSSRQAKHNFDRSPWKDRMKLIESPLQTYETTDLYDLIISNPPFFKGHLKSGRGQRDMAMHADELSYNDLAIGLVRLLNENGIAFVMYPEYEMLGFLDCIRALKLHSHRGLIIRNNVNSEIFREVAVITRSKQDFETEDMYIYESGRKYSDWFIELLSPYYLHL